MEPRGYDYGGATGAGGKIRRRPPSRAAAASPYARPAPSPAASAAAAVASQGGGWFSRIISAGASRLLPSLFRKPPPQLTAPAQPLPEPLEKPPSRDLLLEARLEPLDTPPSSLPPPLEDDLPHDEENIGAFAHDNGYNEDPQTSAKEKEEILGNSDNHCGMDLEELLKKRTFTRTEFEYLAELLWSRTIGSNSLKPEDCKMQMSEQDSGSRHSRLPVDFSFTKYSVADQVASPAEIAKAYMGSKSSKGLPLRLRLHDPSLPIKSSEASMTQEAKHHTLPLLQSSRLHSSKTSGRPESNFTTPNRSAIYKTSSSPYFKSDVSSPYQTPSNVHTFGRQVLKRKSSAVNNEIVSGPVRRMHRRYSTTSPLLETRPGYRGYIGGRERKVDEGSEQEQSARAQKRFCLNRVGYATVGSLDDKVHANSFGQAPAQSSEMASKILKQLDTLVSVENEKMSELRQKHGDAVAGNLISREKEISAQSSHLGPSPSEVKDTPASVTEKVVDATSNKSDNKNPSTSFLRSHNLVLSSEIDRNKMSVSSNGFIFPIQAGVGAHSLAHSLAPPTPTLASPPVLPVEKQHPSALFGANTSNESHLRNLQSASQEGLMLHTVDNKLNADAKPMPFKNSGQGASFTSNPVFNVVNSKPTSLSNGPGHISNSDVSAVEPCTGSANSASLRSTGLPISTASLKSTQSSSSGGGFTFLNTGIGSFATTNVFVGTTSQSVAAPSLVSSGTGSASTPFGSSSLFGTASSLALDKSKAPSSSTLFSTSQQVSIASSSAAQDKSKAAGSSNHFGFSQQYGTASSSISQDISVSPSIVLSGNQNGHLANSKLQFTETSANNLSFMSSEKSENGSAQSFADSQVCSAPLCSGPPNSGAAFHWAVGSASTSFATAPPSSATSLGFGSSQASTSFGLQNAGSASSLFSPPPSAVFSFTSSTPSIPNPSPTTPFGGPTLQMNGGSMAADTNGSPFPTASPFGLPSSSPSTPTFSTPATQFASSTSSSPGIFGFSQQSQASSGGFSMGLAGGNERPGRRIIRVKKRK